MKLLFLVEGEEHIDIMPIGVSDDEFDGFTDWLHTQCRGIVTHEEGWTLPWAAGSGDREKILTGYYEGGERKIPGVTLTWGGVNE